MPPGRTLLTLVAAGALASAAAVASAALEDPPGAAVAASAASGPAPSDTPVLSARRLPEWLADGASDGLAEAVAAYADSIGADSCTLVRDGGRTLVEHRADVALTPASTMKVLTALAALEVLGPEHHFVTRVVAGGPPSRGVVDGDLHLVGGGDPLLQTAGYEITWTDPEHPPPHSDLTALADALVADGLTRVRGAVVGDGSRYDDERYPASWPRRYAANGESGPLSALIVNDGFTGLSDDPDTPRSGVAPGDPTLLAAETLHTLLTDRGVVIDGRPTTGTADDDATTLAELRSPPLSEVVAQTLTYSDNTTAELLVKEIGYQRRGEGSTAAGTAEIAAVLDRIGPSAEGAVVADGSGLDRADAASCSLLVDALVADGPDGPLAAGLAAVGEDGTLRRRLRDTPAEGRVRAKTGTLAGVSALAGWVEGSDGRQRAFAIVVNGDSPDALAAQDALVLALVAHPDGPEPGALAPP